MQKINLVQVKHDIKIGHKCPPIEPNIKEDSLFYFEGSLVGFYIKNLADFSTKASQFADIANSELLSDRVPKSTMKRSSGLLNKENEVLQYSTIIGSVPPKPHMRRAYATKSSVHNIPSANKFVKAMLLLCHESEEIIRSVAPEIFNHQVKIISENVKEKWRFGRMFTSSISNFNISAPFHIDAGNIPGLVNVIITKRYMSDGGHTTIPDYNATVNSGNNSMLVYPAWRNVHGVTPIKPFSKEGYRNSLVFYPLKAFVCCE